MSYPSLSVAMTRTSLEVEPVLYLGFMGESILIKDLAGGSYSPSYIPLHILETAVSEEIALRLVTKVPLLSYLVEIVELVFQTWYVCKDRRTNLFQEITISIQTFSVSVSAGNKVYKLK